MFHVMEIAQTPARLNAVGARRRIAQDIAKTKAEDVRTPPGA
jgi:hypothetical protein